MNYKDAFHRTVHSAPGGVDALAVRMGYSTGLLRNKANPNSTTNVLSADDLFNGCAFTGDYAAMHAFCAGLGFVCTKIDEQPASDMAVLESVTGLWKELGNFGTEVHAALADGRIEKHEVNSIDAALFVVFRLAMELRARLNGMAEK